MLNFVPSFSQTQWEVGGQENSPMGLEEQMKISNFMTEYKSSQLHCEQALYHCPFSPKDVCLSLKLSEFKTYLL